MPQNETTGRRYRVDHGLCPECGREAAPYYLCPEHRQIGAITRMMKRMAKRGIVKEEKEGGRLYWRIPPGWNGPSAADFNWRDNMFSMAKDDARLKPRMAKRPIDLDDTLVEIFRDAGRPLQMHEIMAAWGKLRSQRKTSCLAGDMTAIISAQRRRELRNAKRAAKMRSVAGQPLDYRAEKFAAMVRSGMTRRQVGARAGLTGERVAQIIEPIMGRMSFRETWKGTRDEELSERWMRGETAADIAAALGISRNAVIGKAHRLGLPARPSPIKRKG